MSFQDGHFGSGKLPVQAVWPLTPIQVIRGISKIIVISPIPWSQLSAGWVFSWAKVNKKPEVVERALILADSGQQFRDLEKNKQLVLLLPLSIYYA